MATQQNNIVKSKTLVSGKISVLSSDGKKLISFKLPENGNLNTKDLSLLKSAIRISGSNKNQEALELLGHALGLSEREEKDGFLSYSKSKKSDLSAIKSLIALLNPPKIKSRKTK